MEQTAFRLRYGAGRETFVYAWRPPDARASLQILHGMAEHGGRYARLGRALAAQGIAVYAQDLPGHGRTTASGDTRGHFDDRLGWAHALEAVDAVHRHLRVQHPRQPQFMLGHSMGSFLLQHFLVERGSGLAGAILSATTGNLGPLRPVGAFLLRLEIALFGRRHPSTLGEALSFRAFNRRFRPTRTGFDWLSRDAAEVDRYVADPHCGFRVTAGLWLDLLRACARLTDRQRLSRIPPALPLLLIAGSEDPVCDGARGPTRLADAYRRAGLGDVTVTTYPQARHELLNEVCRDEVTDGIATWLRNHLPA